MKLTKILKLLAAVALVGIVGLNARAAAITNADLVEVKLTLLIQTNGNAGLTVKLTNKDVLQAIANEFTNTFPGKVVPKDAKLAVTSLGGNFEVFTNKTILLANASTNAAAGGDGYQLGLSTQTGVTTKSTATVFDETFASSLTYSQAGGARAFTISGLASEKEHAANTHATTFSESIAFAGSGSGTVNGANAVVSGTVTGAGTGFIF
jgi:hypothetical protein